MTNLRELNERSGLAGLAEIVDGKGGLPAVRVLSPRASGMMYLAGGQVTSWAPAGHDDVLFVSEQARWERGRAIRGGVPVCFPWFGPKPDESSAPAHGFVRTRSWQLDRITADENLVTIVMAIESDEDTRRLWPVDFRLVQRASFGATLTIELTTMNIGQVPFQFEEALHSYYRVGDISQVSVRGLDRVHYLDKVEAFAENTQQGDVTFATETDRVYLDTGAPIEIHDRALGRRLRVETEHARNAVVWNPGVTASPALADLGDGWRHFVCVETANVRTSAITLPAGAEHTMRMRVSVTAQSQ